MTKGLENIITAWNEGLGAGLEELFIPFDHFDFSSWAGEKFIFLHTSSCAIFGASSKLLVNN